MEKVRTFIEKNIKDNSTLIISCSGGPDSMCMLFLLNEYKDRKHLKLVVAHVNHKLRVESDEEEKFVQNYALEHDLLFESVSLDEFKNKKVNEELAREKRYAFLKSLIKKYNAQYLLTAHHGDDLIETVLMRITRGSNLKGYAGIRDISVDTDVTILRPMLGVTKNEILDFNKKEQIPYVLDSSNESLKFTRNRYRKTVLPFLKNEDVHIHEKYLQFSNEIYQYHKFVTDYICSKNLIVDNSIVINKVLEETSFIQRKTVEILVSFIQKNDYFSISNAQVDEIMQLLKGNNRSIDLNNHYKCIKEYNLLKIIKEKDIDDYEYPLVDNVEHRDWKISKILDVTDTSNNTFFLNSSEVKLPLYVRNRKNGECMEVKNLGKKKLSDIFINEKIPKEKRGELPIVVDSDNHVLWIPGIKKSKFAKDKTEKYDIILKYEVRK